MQFKYAQIDNQGICFAVSMLSSDVNDPHLIAIGQEQNVLGWSWDGSTWTEPAPLVVNRYITVGAFLKRFGIHMLPILTSSEPVVQALVVLVRSHTYIDLDDPALAQYLPQLVPFGLITQPEIDELLSVAPQPGEET